MGIDDSDIEVRENKNCNGNTIIKSSNTVANANKEQLNNSISNNINKKAKINETIKKPLNFQVLKTVNSYTGDTKSMARCSCMTLPHGVVETPVFMPVGTQGAIKALTSRQMEDFGCKIMLGNTYHLGNRPGPDIIDYFGGLHKFMNFSGNLLTDSGGFQIVSLLKLAEISEEGVLFESPVDGKPMMLTPEKSIQIQNKIEADIIMALDDVVPVCSENSERFREACFRTVRQIDRCIKAHEKSDKQNLFGIVQGGLNSNLRSYCLNEMIKRDLPGYAIGGLSGGEEKQQFQKIVLQCCQALPKDKPRYLMGIGYPLDLVVCSALGCDMFDCVFPSRAARFGTVFTRQGFIKLRKEIYQEDFKPLDCQCPCTICRKYTRAALHHFLRSSSSISCHLLTEHNIVFVLDLMKRLRESILKKKFSDFVRGFLSDMFLNEGLQIPDQVVDALNAVGVDLTDLKPTN